MKNIQYFKLFESRTAELSEKEFLNLVKTKCRDFIKTPKYLQRIKSSHNGEYSYINPKQSHRNPLMKDGDGGGVFQVIILYLWIIYHLGKIFLKELNLL